MTIITHRALPFCMASLLMLGCEPDSAPSTSSAQVAPAPHIEPAKSPPETNNKSDDPRRAMAVTEAERAVIKEVMRENLQTIAEILTAAAAGDRSRVVKLADAARDSPGPGRRMPRLRRRLPNEWRAMGRAVHRGFGDIAQNQAEQDDTSSVQGDVARVLSTCNACHETYRLVLVTEVP